MNEWINVKDRLPEPEVEVIVLVKQNNLNSNEAYKVITTAIYEDGSVSEWDSMWNWFDTDFNYDDANDLYLIPEGWWEYKHYNPDDVYNGSIDGIVTHWMPLPEPPNL